MIRDLILELQYLVEDTISVIYDSLEEFFDSVEVVYGKRLREIFGITLGFLIMSVLARIFSIYTFITPLEALTAVILVGVILVLDIINQKGISSLKTKLFNLKEKE